MGILDRLKYFLRELDTQGRRGENDDVMALGIFTWLIFGVQLVAIATFMNSWS